MKFTFQYQVPDKHLQHSDVIAVLNVHAEVLNIGTERVTPFIHSVSTTGPIALWNLKGSEELFSDVANAAIAVAELNSVNALINQAIKSDE